MCREKHTRGKGVAHVWGIIRIIWGSDHLRPYALPLIPCGGGGGDGVHGVGVVHAWERPDHRTAPGELVIHWRRDVVDLAIELLLDSVDKLELAVDVGLLGVVRGRGANGRWRQRRA